MKNAMRKVLELTQEHPTAVCWLITLLTLSVDFVTGREVRFPLLYLLPIGLAAWMGRKSLAYTLSFFMPVLRVSFENVWQLHELPSFERINAAIEILALALYVFLIGRKATEAKQLKKTVTTKDEEMQYLRTFTRLVGTTLQGRGISPGLADGVALVYQPEKDNFAIGELTISEREVDSEIKRFDRALAASIQELNNIRKEFEDQKSDLEVGLLAMRLAMLNDPSFQKKCKQRIKEDLVRVEQAVTTEVQEMETRLKDLKQELMRERSVDVRDLGHQILRHLRTSGEETSTQLSTLPPKTILVAEELLLSDALLIDPVNLAALVTEKTGPASHVAILARGRNLPAVCDIEDATILLASGDHLLVDAEMGTVTVAPSLAQLDHFATRKAQSALISSAEERKPVPPSLTRNGMKIGLYANIGSPDEASVVLEYNLDGIGLFRSEFIFLEAEKPPDLETQTAAYSEVVAMLDPRPVVIRTMDLGGEKIPHFDRKTTGMAWRLGLRGLAYSLSEKTMFRTQVLAILRAAQKGNVKIMFPMVIGAADLGEARALIDDVWQEEPFEKKPPIGAMIETPAAAFGIQEILQVVDFICIGTNDLTHSILAMDRASPGPYGMFSYLHPSVLKATEQVVREALNQGVEVTVCGEAASDPSIACLLVGMGVRALSLNPFQVAGVRHALRQVTIDQTEALARQALATTNPKEIQEIVGSILYKTLA